MITLANELLGAARSSLGTTCVLDTGLGPGAVADLVRLVRPVLTDWKLGWTSWFICDRGALVEKITTLREAGGRVIAGGSAAEIAMARGKFLPYLDVCASLGIGRVEIGEGFIASVPDPEVVVDQARQRDLEVQYETGRKNAAEDAAMSTAQRIEAARLWIEAGAAQVVFEAREAGVGYALFRGPNQLNQELLDQLLARLQIERLVFEAPTRETQITLFRTLGPRACIGNVYPHELLRAETIRRLIHADTVDLQGEDSA